MSLKNYLILCAALTVVTILAVTLVPGVAQAIEGAMLLFLSTNAS